MTMFFSRLLIAELRVDQINGLKKQFGLTDEQIKACNEADPSPKGTYSRWLCQVYTQTKGKDVAKLQAVQSLTEPLRQFIKLCNNPDFPKDKRDIGPYTPATLMELVGNQRRYLRNLSPKAIEKLIKTEGLPGAKLIWDGGGFKMWYVTNYKYAMILGSNTHWCTAANENYASQYSLMGGLYITYYNGKPFLQGHSSAGQTDLLDVSDHAPNLLLPEMAKWFETVEHPIMTIFKRLCESRFYNFLSTLDAKEKTKDKQAICNYALATDNLATVLAVIKAEIWWPEGWELLIDSPNYLKEALNQYTAKDICKKLKKQDFASDIARVCLDHNLIEYAVMLDNSHELLGDMAKSILSGKTDRVGSLDKETQDALDEVGVKQIKEKGKKAPLARGEEGNVRLLGSKSIMQYWRQFVNQEWPEMADVIGAEPDYKKRCEVLAPVKRLLRVKVGDTVAPGPDCPERFTKGMVKEVNPDLEEVIVTIDGVDKKFTQKERGWYELQRSPTSEVKYSIKLTPDPTNGSQEFKVGDVVIPARFRQGSDDVGEYGTITRVTEGNNCTIEWEGGMTDHLYLPDASYAIPAVSEKSPEALCNHQKKEKRNAWADYKKDEFVWTPQGVGYVHSIDPGDNSVLVRWVDGDSAGETRWYYPDSADEEGGHYPIRKLERKPESWHVVSPQPETLEVGMWVHRGPDWEYGDQDIRGMVKHPDPSKIIVPGEVDRIVGEGWFSVQWPNNGDHYQYTETIKSLEVIEKY